MVPDFYLPRYGICIEFFGVVNKASYYEITENKIRAYRENFIDLIQVYPCNMEKPNWGKEILYRIDEILLSRLEEYRKIVPMPEPLPLKRPKTKKTLLDKLLNKIHLGE